jgi:purine-binding chemotaxis protein CheW
MTALTLTIAGEPWALPAASAGEILRPRPLTRIPLAPPGLLGLANLRGQVLPVVSLARLLGLPDTPVTAAARIIVDHQARVGLLADAVGRLGPAADDARLIDVAALLARAFPALAGSAPAPATPFAASARVPDQGATSASALVSLVCFQAAGQDYAWPLSSVIAALARPMAAEPVPHAGAGMLGVMPWRGGVLPLVCASALLDRGVHAMSARDAAACPVLVVQAGALLIGLVVDALRTLLRVPAGQIDPVPPVLMRGQGEARIEGVCRLEGGRRLVCVLSPARLFDEAVMATLAAAGSTVAVPTAQATETRAMQHIAVFHLGGEAYGLPAGAVQAIIKRPARVTPLPGAPNFLRGAVNYRGAVVPLIDQPARFGLAPDRVPDGAGRIMVLKMPARAGGNLTAGLAVDGVSAVRAMSPRDIAAVPPLAVGRPGLFTGLLPSGGEQPVLLVDPGVLLDDAERDALAGFAAAHGGARAA